MNKLKQNGGMVDFITTAGKDYVKSQMPVAEAQKLIDNATSAKPSHKFDGFNLCVDKQYYFSTEKRSDSDV